MREHQITVPTDPRIAEGYSSARALGRTILAVLSVAVLGLLAGLVLWALPAAAASDSPTPYTVDRTGITLPAGEVFPAHGHVNVRWADGSAGVHFDPNNHQPSGVWIGQSSIPWNAFGVPADACITWVQISTFDEHFGEGGQLPVCLTEEEPWPAPAPTPTATDPSSPHPSPEPSESVPSGPSEPKPTVTPVPDPGTEPTVPPTSSPVDTDPPGSVPVDTPAPTEYRSEVSAVDPPAELAATGANAWGVGITAAIALILGTYLVVFEVRRRRGERCPECGGPLVPVSRTHWAFGDWDGVSCRDCWWTEAR